MKNSLNLYFVMFVYVYDDYNLTLNVNVLEYSVKTAWRSVDELKE